MINQLIVAGSDYFSPGTRDQANSDKPTEAEIIIERLLAGEMSVPDVPADLYLELLQTVRGKMITESESKDRHQVQTVFANGGY